MARAKREPKPKPPPDPNKLAREAAGSYRTGDGRFTVRQDPGGRWYVSDAEQTNDFGLELVLGPFATIAEAKAALATQREQPTGAPPAAKLRLVEPMESEAEPAPAPRLDRKRMRRPVAVPEPAQEPEPTPKPEPKPTPAAELAPAPAPTPMPKPTPELNPAQPPAPELESPPRPPKIDYRPAKRRRTRDASDAVADAMRAINDAWTSRDPDAMRDHLDKHVVFVQPGCAARTESADAAIESYRDFTTSAGIQAYAESKLVIDLRGETAVATYRFEIDYERDARQFHQTGHDLFVFARSGGRWLAIWRLLVPDPPAEPGSGSQ